MQRQKGVQKVKTEALLRSGMKHAAGTREAERRHCPGSISSMRHQKVGAKRKNRDTAQSQRQACFIPDMDSASVLSSCAPFCCCMLDTNLGSASVLLHASLQVWAVPVPFLRPLYCCMRSSRHGQCLRAFFLRLLLPLHAIL